MSRNLLSLFVLLLFWNVVAGQSRPIISVTVDRDNILIGEQFDLLLDAQFSDLGTVSFFKVDSLAHFEILKKGKIDTSAAGNDIILSQKLTLTSWDSGRWQIPSISLIKTGTRSKPIPVNVSFSPFDPKQEYHDVKEIVDVESPLQSYWYWYLLGAVVLAAVALLIFGGNKKEAKVEVIDTNAYTVAMSDLKKIQAEGLAEKDVKAYYVALIDVFRKYLHRGKGMISFTKTTDNLMLDLKSFDLPEEVRRKLAEVLQVSDAVKYAKYQPLSEERNNDLLVIQTGIDVIEKK